MKVAPTGVDVERIAQTVTVYADIGDRQQSTVIAADVDAELRTGPEFSIDGVCDLVVPANAGAFGDELLVSMKFAELAAFVHAVEARTVGITDAAASLTDVMSLDISGS